jgi:hypothetical protein
MIRKVMAAIFSLLLCVPSIGLAQVNLGDLRITEIMSASSHPSGGANDDWIEIVNFSNDPIDLDGYLWDDGDQLFGGDFTAFPEMYTPVGATDPVELILQPNETILLVREDDANIAGGFRESWGLSDSQIILGAEDMISFGDTFSGLSGSNGDEVNLYFPGPDAANPNVNAQLIAQRVFGAALNGTEPAGRSFEWDPTDASTAIAGSANFSTDGVNFAYIPASNGSTLMPGPGTDQASPGLYIGMPTAGPDGDFNGDEVFDCLDVDALVAEIVNGTNLSEFDMTQEGDVDGDDLTAWLAAAGAANLASGNPYLVGDANLDGNVNGQDFVAWNNNKFQAVAAFCSGDFNADGNVDGQDFVEWNNNKFTSADGVSAVPEPAFGWFFGAGLLIAIRRRR